MFIFSLTYVKPISEVERFLPAHIDFLDEHYKRNLFMCSRGQAVLSCATAQTWLRQKQLWKKTPFTKEGIAQYEIIEFVPSKTSEAFHNALQEHK